MLITVSLFDNKQDKHDIKDMNFMFSLARIILYLFLHSRSVLST